MTERLSRRGRRKARKLAKQALPAAPTPPMPVITPTHAVPANSPKPPKRQRASRRQPRHRPDTPPPPRVHRLAKLVTSISTAYWLLSVANAAGSTGELLHRRAREAGSGWIAEPLLDRTLKELCRSRLLRREFGVTHTFYVLTATGEELLEIMWDERYSLDYVDPEDQEEYTHE